MDLEMIRATFGWCAVLNMGILLYWFLFLTFAKKWVYRMHRRWFNLTDEQFDKLHYQGMTMFKLLTFMFFIVPYLALRIVG